jgi:cytoskeletal protein RodZ
MKIRSLSGLGTIVVFLVVAIAAAALSIDATLSAYAQNATTTPQPSQNQTADPQQIKNYLTQAIQALDSGNNTMAAEQVGLAEDQLEGMTGTEVDDEDGEDEEEEGEVEEGAGEDADEPGDVDTNDEEDTP